MVLGGTLGCFHWRETKKEGNDGIHSFLSLRLIASNTALVMMSGVFPEVY